jgi:hypothetical protein
MQGIKKARPILSEVDGHQKKPVCSHNGKASFTLCVEMLPMRYKSVAICIPKSLPFLSCFPPFGRFPQKQ